MALKATEEDLTRSGDQDMRYHHKNAFTCEAHPIQVEDYLQDEPRKKNAPQTSNRIKELIDIYATLYGNKEPVGLDTCNTK